ncbi:hypothetical protein [Pseudomonas sp. PICF141]|uniref:hypothetical protein n=1 Tax=Pseudomonas sp. PICF141 TaxID=1949067 RepID=UPI0015B160D0|nr:hypothetical protein [Pseudomonas sp. PICF141]
MTFYQSRNAGVLAKPLSVEGVDDNDPTGHIPRDFLIMGTRIVIPYWIDPVPNDELWVVLRQNGVERRLYTEFYPAPLTVPFLYFDLTALHLATDGIAFLYYKIWKGSGGTDDPSPERQLTIDHRPPLTLAEPRFRHATLWGYLNNNTDPPLTNGATVVIPAFINIAVPGDVAKIHWRGYSSLNGSGPEVPGTYGVWDKPLSAADITNGFDHVVPFLSHISLLFNDDSAVVICQLFRGGRLIAESNKGLVKIDRVTPGESGPSGLNDGEIKMTAQEKIVRQPRPRPESLGQEPFGVLATSVNIDKLADESIAISVLESGELTFKLARFTEEDDADEVDVYFAKGTGSLELLQGFIPLGPIAGRDPAAIEIKVPTDMFVEDAQPATPTPYQVQLIVYKGGGGTDDPSNIVTFNIDRTAPFEVKYPSRIKNPPTPAPTFTNAPADAQRLVNEAWMKDPANAELKFTVNVGYPLRRLDDDLEVHLTSAGVSIQVFKGMVDATGAFTVQSTELRKLPNGRVMIHYFWTDLPGNRSASSTPAAVLTLGLALDPKLNKAPLVPFTDPNATTTIYLDNIAGLTAIVERASIDNAEPGDEITLTIEDPNDPTIFVEIGTQPLADADVPFTVTYSQLNEIYGTAQSDKQIKVYFDLVRGMDLFRSPAFFFTTNLYPSGGIYPELPDLTNPAFALPVVTGASNTTDQLLPGDRDKPGKFTVTLALTDPPITSGETAKCYLNNQLVGDFSPFGDATAIEFSVTISALIIAALPTPTVPARWTRQKSGIDKNVISSSPKTVTVSGKKIDLLAPAVKVRNPELKNQIDCFAMINATTTWQLGVLIPEDLINLPIGKVITVHFAAYRDPEGTDLILRTEASAPYTIKAAVKLVVTPARTGKPEISFMGNLGAVGEADNFKAAQPVTGTKAFGKYWYTADIGGTQTSEPIIMPLDSITSSSEYCDRLPVPAAV